MADRRISETFMWIAMQGDFPRAFASVACLLYFLSMILKSKIIVIFAENGITGWTFQGGFGRLLFIPCGQQRSGRQSSAVGKISAGTLILDENLILQMR
jgi:hypothetical protein